ncbi:FHA domain-containing protein [Arthrobacter crusticola]|uniref:FHA domain-containing protein n=1 Tax=Arthrobacter crusticola TaxID=2547960 RepID=A0A4R5TMF2_9MICC|nr:FtsK/SpoIIIE domain-containing protein [Arthrobacter crusticola]TDK23559.1 FHA domain-containing protein [Arthrobacter crusticola]
MSTISADRIPPVRMVHILTAESFIFGAGMHLHLSVVAGPGAPAATASRLPSELVVDLRRPMSGRDLAEHLTSRLGSACLSVAGIPLAALEPGVPPLGNGAVLVAGSGSAGPGPWPARSILVLVVHSGPDAGCVFPLVRGSYSIGRWGCDISLRDPALSRCHATLAVGEDRVLLRDAGSANGTWVDGHRITEAPVTSSSSLLVGGSRCALALTGAHRPQFRPGDLGEPLDITTEPVSERERFLAPTVLLPVVGGAVLALALQMWLLLAFAAVASLTGLLSIWAARRRRRRFEAAVRSAADADAQRRRAAVMDAGSVALHAYGRGPEDQWADPGMASPPAVDDVSRTANIRLGEADQQANLRLNRRVPEWTPPLLKRMPLVLPFRPASERVFPSRIRLHGPPEDVLGMGRLILLQFSAVLGHNAGVVCRGLPSELPTAGRFLPGVRLVSTPAALEGVIREMPGAVLIEFSAAPGPVPAVEWAETVHIAVSPGRATLVRVSGRVGFVPDLVGAQAFEACARALGTASSRTPPGRRRANTSPSWDGPQLPDPPSVKGLAERWADGAGQDSLEAPIGDAPGGPQVFDLVRQGPHLLVAGTTGSGKSQLLRSLVLGIAARYPPPRVNFLLLDFKGGSGLGPLSGLPHCVGFLTDLSTESVERALRSLRAELRRREELFAAHSVQDIADLSGSMTASLPRLVVVVDEFRRLSDDVPGAADDLMKCAALGRSLGVHLVLATQRPTGAVTADIRANVTTSIALRVQNDMESMDLIGSTQAAAIAVDLPGRGFLKVGSAGPREFQVASAAGPPPGAGPVRELDEWLQGTRTDTPDSAQEEDPHTVRFLVERIAEAARLIRTPDQYRPVLPPLPSELPPAGPEASVPEALTLGLLDLPDRQSQPLLRWAPGGSHLAFIGSASAGAAGALRHTLTECLLVLPDTHLYILDGDFTLAFASDALQTGAYAAAHEPVRAERILFRIAAVVLERLSAPAAPGTPPILLAVSGWGRWAGTFRSRRFSTAEDLLSEIVRDGPAAGVSLVITGERELTAARFAGHVSNRIYLPLGTAPEVTAGWPRLPQVEPVPGRGVAFGRFGSVLLGGPTPAQLTIRPRAWAAAPRRPQRRPFRVDPLPLQVRPTDLAPAAAAGGACRIPIGIGGDEPETVFLELPAGSLWPVVGPPASGRSTFLALLENQAPPSLHPLRLRPQDDPAAYWRAAGSRPPLATDPPRCLLLIDDAETLPEGLHPILEAFLASGARAVLAAGPRFVLGQRPLARLARAAGHAVILAPRSETDAEVFGVRLEPPDGIGPPGRAVVLDPGRQLPVQLAQVPGCSP